MSIFHGCNYASTVVSFSGLPVHDGYEVAFSGRSNAGKSSAINALCNHKRLAFTSKTPGRTQWLNFFNFAKREGFLVDLPGYGFAKAPKGFSSQWNSLIGDYLSKRSQLAGLVLVMDIRHALMPSDEHMIEWFSRTGKPIHILLTKADKLSKSQRMSKIMAVRKQLPLLYDKITVQLYSSFSKEGCDEFDLFLQNWLQLLPKA